MESKNQLLHIQTKRGNLNDPAEHERILMMYAGIFKNNIKDFAETLAKKNKPLKNYSR